MSTDLIPANRWGLTTSVNTEYLRPKDEQQALLIGAPLHSSIGLDFSNTTAYFNGDPEQSYGGTAYFINFAYGHSFIPFGGVFVGAHPRGTPSAPTQTQATDWLTGLAGAGFDGTRWALSGTHTIPGFWAAASTAPVAQVIEQKLFMGGVTTPMISWDSNGNAIKFNESLYDSDITFYYDLGSSLSQDGATGDWTFTQDVAVNGRVTVGGTSSAGVRFDDAAGGLIYQDGSGNLQINTKTGGYLYMRGSSASEIYIGASADTGTLQLRRDTSIEGTLTLSGATTDITTGTNEDLTLDPNGSGALNLNAGSGGVAITTDAGNSDITLDPHGTGLINAESAIDFSDATGNKILWYSTTYKSGIEAGVLYHDVPTSTRHEFRVNGTEVAQVNGSGLEVTGNLVGAERPYAEFSHSSAIDVLNSGSTGSVVYLNWDTQDSIDTDTYTHDTVTNNTRVTVDVTGRYHIKSMVRADNTGANRVSFYGVVRVNGSTISRKGAINDYSRGAAYGQYLTPGIDTELDLTANDYIEIGIECNDRDQLNAVNTVAADSTLIIRRIG